MPVSGHRHAPGRPSVPRQRIAAVHSEPCILHHKPCPLTHVSVTHSSNGRITSTIATRMRLGCSTRQLTPGVRGLPQSISSSQVQALWPARRSAGWSLRRCRRSCGPATWVYRARNSTTAQPRTAANGRIRLDSTGPRQDQPLTASMLVRGCFHRWWQVMGSNHRRLSRRFYRPFPLATRATCLAPPQPDGTVKDSEPRAGPSHGNHA
jgi:hypothetical protein